MAQTDNCVFYKPDASFAFMSMTFSLLRQTAPLGWKSNWMPRNERGVPRSFSRNSVSNARCTCSIGFTMAQTDNCVFYKPDASFAFMSMTFSLLRQTPTHWYQIRGACLRPYKERRSRHTYPGSSKPSGNSLHHGTNGQLCVLQTGCVVCVYVDNFLVAAANTHESW
jgi:hypothetical protein